MPLGSYLVFEVFADDVPTYANCPPTGSRNRRLVSKPEIRDLTTELFGITPWHEQVFFDDFVTKSRAINSGEPGGHQLGHL